jgi:hypothetical protein
MMDDFFDLFSFFAIIAVVMGTIILMFGVYAYFSCQREARLYNQRFNKNYTTWDFFWAGETIKSFLNEGKQETQNINIKGAIPVKISQE